MLASRLGTNKTVALALTIMAIGLVDFAFLDADATFVQLIRGLVLIGVGSGLVTPLTSDILGALPKARCPPCSVSS